MTSLRVLVVDDFPDVTDALSVLLGVLGHEVIAARSGRDARALFTAQLPDVALFDVGLPDLTGYELARELRRLPGGRRPFLAALTGWGTNKDRSDAFTAGFDIHIVKPVDAAKVSEVLRAATIALAHRDQLPI